MENFLAIFGTVLRPFFAIFKIPCIVTRVFSDAGMDMEYESGGVVSKQFYSRQ